MKAHFSAQYKKYLLFFALIIPISVVVTVIFYGIAPTVVKASLPAVTTIIQRSYPETELVDIKYKNSGGRRVIEFTMKITKWFEGVDIPFIDNLTNSILISMQFVTAIIFYTLLFSWPFISMRKRLLAAVIFIPFVMLFILLDISFSAITFIELTCKKNTPGYVLNETILCKAIIFIGYFFNNGGRQFLGVLMFLLPVVPFHRSSAEKGRQLRRSQHHLPVR